MGKEYKIYKKNNWLASVLQFIVKHILRRKMRVINLNEEMPHGSIFIGNHSGASGPMCYKAFLTPPAMMTWGAHQMCENYRSRRRYLVDIFYGQKLGYGKTRSKISGTLFGLVSGLIYWSAGIIPVYYDNRLKKTFTWSIKCLEEDVNVLVFPENSDQGYKDVLLDDFHPGYISMTRLAEKKLGRELPVYTLYHSKKDNVIIIGKPHYISELSKTMSRDEINDFFRNYMNSLYTEYISTVKADTKA